MLGPLRWYVYTTLDAADLHTLLKGTDRNVEDIAHSLRLLTGKSKPFHKMTLYEKNLAEELWNRRIKAFEKDLGTLEANISKLEAEIAALKKDLGS